MIQPYLRKCKKCKKNFSSESARKLLCKTCKIESNMKLGIDKRKRFYGANFQRKRQIVLERDSHRCKICKSKKQLHINHKNKITFDNRLNNLETLCVQCHMSIHRNEGKTLLRVLKGALGTRLVFK